MKFRSVSLWLFYVVGVVALVYVAISLSSCNGVYEDLEPCPQGLRLRFVYDYNMEFANAFPSQVDCLTVLLYDREGRYLNSYYADYALTSDENWRMEIDLPSGDYCLLAYGGLDCDDASFRFVQAPSQTLMQNLEVYLPSSLITSPKGMDLHPLFYGSLDVNVPEDDTDYTEATVKMMKDTNDLRIILQNVDGTPVNDEDFTFSVTADNTLFDYENNIIPTDLTEFYPWSKGTAIAGSGLDEDIPVQVGFAEFSLSRLMANASARLNVRSEREQKTVLSIPIVDYLLLLKSEHFASMGDQQFLDRESRWSMIFFLDSESHWISTHIVINGWIVRINNINGFD